jgi:Rps23 Pro-64 3,4-dihydroxylase Tpa1-like proline 4-hydroxylase
MPYIVNNEPVGHHPSEIERKHSYLEFFEKIGNSADNIKVIPNFLSDEEIKYVLSHVDERRRKSFVSQKDNDGKPTAWMHNYEGIIDRDNLFERVLDEVKKAYGYDNIEKKNTDRLNIARWDKGTKLKLHVDDLGYVTDNHLPTLIYLNDDYEGGELSFATHDVTIKPKVGDLIIFPGNMHYAHEVKEVLSGVRYTLPIWFTIP